MRETQQEALNEVLLRSGVKNVSHDEVIRGKLIIDNKPYTVLIACKGELLAEPLSTYDVRTQKGGLGTADTRSPQISPTTLDVRKLKETSIQVFTMLDEQDSSLEGSMRIHERGKKIPVIEMGDSAVLTSLNGTYTYDIINQILEAHKQVLSSREG